jgi:CBS-domain-containing membrane protein
MKRFIHRHQPPANLRSILLAGLGAAFAVGLLALVTDHSTLLLLMAPFGASAVLLFAAPAAHLSQPANLIGGHVMAAAIGLAAFSLLPAGFAASACAVGLAVAAMVAFRIVHPPAGATALVAATAKGWGFLFFPVLSGSLLLVLIAWAYHRSSGTPYPLHHQP